MNRKNFIKLGFIAILFMLLVSASGCGSIGSDSQITQMNQAFLPDATNEAEASPEEQVPYSTANDSIVLEENRPKESSTSVSGNDKSGGTVAGGSEDAESDDGSGNTENGNAVANGSGDTESGNAVANGSKDSRSKNDSAAADNSKSSGADNNSNSVSSNGGSKNSDTNSSNNDGSKVHKNTPRPASTKKPSPIKKPQPTSTPVVNQKVCTISIDCRTILDNMDKLNSAKKPFVPENGIILPSTPVKLQQGDTVFDILSRVCREREIHMEASYTPLYGTYYVEGIHQLYEFDCGKDMSGWKYFVNGVSVNYSCSKYEVKAGDRICWSYTCDGGKDLEDGAAGN